MRSPQHENPFYGGWTNPNCKVPVCIEQVFVPLPGIAKVEFQKCPLLPTRLGVDCSRTGLWRVRSIWRSTRFSWIRCNRPVGRHSDSTVGPPPTLSLGYFQPLDKRHSHSASLPCKVVRRSTGGGAIVHDQELTYSLVWPRGRRPSREIYSSSKGTAWLYRLVHQALIDVLTHFGVVATFVGDAATDATPFLCFQRRSCWDVEVGGVKILGSGQRSSRAAVLQHGSLLLAASKYAPEIAGIAQVSHLLPVKQIGQRWAAEIAASGNLQLEKSLLSSQERCRSREIAAQKYTSPNWTNRR